MPIPTPHEGESGDDFHGRCMTAIWDEFKDKDNGKAQANAICFDAYRRHKSIDTGTGLVAYDLQGQKKEASSMSVGGPVRLFGRIEKVDEMPDGTIKVHGIASTEDKDDQGEVVKADAMRAAIPDYMRFGAVREMHGLSAAGRALECNCGNDNITRIVAHVVDPIAVKKVQNRVYNGFSIGGRVVERAPGDYHTITGLALHEISLVDRPANPQATIDLWKSTSVGTGDRDMPDGLGTIGDLWADALAKVGPQIWQCGDPSHKHGKKDEAARCIMEKRGKPMMMDKDDMMMSDKKKRMMMSKDDMMMADKKKRMSKDDMMMSRGMSKDDMMMSRGMSKEDMMMAGRKPFPNAAPPFGAKSGEPGGDASKHGLPGQNGWPHAEKHGEPGQNDLPKEWSEKHGEPGQNNLPKEWSEKHGWPGQNIATPGEPPGGENSEANFDGDDDSDDRETSAETAGGSYWPEGDERHEDFGKKGDKPKGNYGKVRYADPGYQKDGKPRYPIDTEEHVRAALSYINMPKNAKKYSPGNYGKVKSAIESAAKRLGIEVSKRVASEADEIELAEMVMKTIGTISMFDDLVIEKAGRRMAAADMMMMNMAHDMIGKMTDMTWCMKMDPHATQDTSRNMEEKPADRGPDSGTEHYRLGENSTQDTAAKRGMRHSMATMGHLKKAHDALCRAGAACPAHMDMGMKAATTTEEGAMSATTDDEGAAVAQALKKALKKNDKLEDKISALTTQVSNLTVHMEYLAKGSKGEPPAPAPAPERTKKKLEKALAERDERLNRMEGLLEQIAKQPLPGSASHMPSGLLEISKAQDGGQQRQPVTEEQLKAANEVRELFKNMSEEERFYASLKLSHMQPYVQRR